MKCAPSSASRIGLVEGKLKPCPSSPNCVSSQALDEAHSIEPLRYSGPTSQARERLIAVIDAMPRTKIIKSQENYIHAESTTKLFRFVDDVEFYFPPDGETIHVRSASRVGYSDLGANRKRIEEIRARLEQKDVEPRAK